MRACLYTSFHIKHLTIFVETDILGILPEALTANVHAVLADQTSLVGAYAAFAGSFSVFLWMRVPNSLVSHFVRVFFLSVDVKRHAFTTGQSWIAQIGRAHV